MIVKKRTFSELRSLLLIALLGGQHTTNQLSIRSGINWRTVEAHLMFLIGKGLVTEVLKSDYVRIFKLTFHGEELARQSLQQFEQRQLGIVPAVAAFRGRGLVHPAQVVDQ